MAAATAYPAQQARTLIALFLGDRDSTGYYHPFLIRELCRLRQPKDLDALRQFVYGPMPVDRIDPDGYETLERGYLMWISDLAKEPV